LFAGGLGMNSILYL